MIDSERSWYLNIVCVSSNQTTDGGVLNSLMGMNVMVLARDNMMRVIAMGTNNDMCKTNPTGSINNNQCGNITVVIISPT